MADLGALLALELQGPRPSRLSTSGLVAYAGRAESVRILSGLDARPKRAEYGSDEGYRAALRSWTNAQRSVQRATAGEGRQQRGRSGERPLTPAQQRQAFQFGIRRRLAAFRANGARVRMVAMVTVDTPTTEVRWRLKKMPASGPAVYLKPTQMRHILSGDPFSVVAARFEEAFFEEYPITGAIVGDVISLKMWPEG